MDQGPDRPAKPGMPTTPYVIGFARRHEAGFGTRQMPRCDRPHFPGRRIGDLRSPWRAITMLGIVLAFALATWFGFVSA